MVKLLYKKLKNKDQKIMNNRKCTKTHEWVETNSDNNDVLTVGITEHAQSLLGDLVFVELPIVGKKLKQGEEFAVVESVKAASDVYAPVSGTIAAVNENLQSNPGLINKSPYSDGWLVKIVPEDISELNVLMDQVTYELSQEA